MAHTPGPWRVDHGPAGSDQLDLQIWTTDNPIYLADVWSSEEDACLIAAAPELLEALKNIAALGPFKGTRAWGTAVDKAVTAIAKAEGRDASS